MIKVASLFTQVLSLIDRAHFCKAVAELEAEKSANECHHRWYRSRRCSINCTIRRHP